MSSNVVAVLVGVAKPAPFTYRGLEYRFGSLNGVENDLRWYEEIIKSQVPADRLTLRTLTSASETTVAALEQTLAEAASSAGADSTFVLALVGHGFQARDDEEGEEDDRLDELFAASDGPVADDFFGSLWTVVPATGSVVVFADTCSADGLAIQGGEVIEPVIAQTQAGPSRMFISASMSWERAAEAPSRKGTRGVMTLALEDAWNYKPESRTSYLNWFNETVGLLSVRRPHQHPRLHYVGPNQKLLARISFS